jgi:hypothetical protein
MVNRIFDRMENKLKKFKNFRKKLKLNSMEVNFLCQNQKNE